MIDKDWTITMGLQLHYAHEVHTLYISCSHCSISTPVSRKRQTRRERYHVRCFFLPYLGSGFFSSVSILTQCGGSDLRHYSYHGNIQEKNISNTDRLLQKDTIPKPQPEHSGEGVQPIGAEYCLKDSCPGQSDCSKLEQTI